MPRPIECLSVDKVRNEVVLVKISLSGKGTPADRPGGRRDTNIKSGEVLTQRRALGRWGIWGF